MTKNTLFAATAAVALMSGILPAMAHDISGTGLYVNVDSTDTASAPLPLAEELRFSAGITTTTQTATQGDLTYEVVSSGGTYPAGQLVLTLDVSNAIFTEDLAAATVVQGNGTCAPTSSLSTGGEEGGSEVTLIVSGFETCGDLPANSVEILLPIQVTGGGDVEAGFGLRTLAGDLPVDGGRDAATFIELVDAFAGTVTAGDTAPIADVAEGYEDFTVDNEEIATFEVEIDTDAFTTIALTAPTPGAANQADATDIADIRLTATAGPGSFAGYNLALDGAPFTSPSTATVGTVRRFDINTATAMTYSITAVDNAGTATGSFAANDVIQATDISLSAIFDLTTDNNFTASTGPFVDFTVTGDTTGIDRNGTSVVVPWIGSATQSANGVISQIRVANNGTEETGQVFVRLLSAAPNSAVEPGGSLVSLTAQDAGIEAGSELVITQAALEMVLGNYVRGDIEVVVEAEPETLSLKRRDTRNGVTSEMSLGSALNDSNND